VLASWNPKGSLQRRPSAALRGARQDATFGSKPGANPVDWHVRMELPINREIVVLQAAPISLAVARVEIKAAELTDQIEKAFKAVYAAVNSGKLQRPGLNVIVYRRLGGGEVEVECGVQVATRFDEMGEVLYRETPAGRTATVTHHGPYDRMGETHAALVAWAASHGLPLTGVR
jgi:effector-binding domain-containing protein